MRYHQIFILFLLIIPFFANTQEIKYMLPQEEATYYHDKFVGRRTSSGEIFSQKKYTAAHKYLKNGTLVKVTNLINNRVVIVKINDRCPKEKVIDLSRIAAKQIGIIKSGRTKVNIEVLPNSYYDLWLLQDSIFAIINKYTDTDSLQESYQNTIELFQKNNNTNFEGKYYLEMELVENATNIISLFPEKLKVYTRVIILENNGNQRYKIVVIPFNDEKEAEEAKTKVQSLFENITIRKVDG